MIMPRRRLGPIVSAIAMLGFVVFGCKLSSLPGKKVNLFEGTAAQDGATRIKEKLGASDLKVKYIEIHQDRMQITIQDPAKPKNFDEYTYENGAVKGPQPVQSLVLGNQELTADKSRLFNLSDVNLAAVPQTCSQALQKAQIEDGKPELISIDWQHASLRLTKEEKAKKAEEERNEFTRQARSGKMVDPMARLKKSMGDLLVTWRVYVQGPHMSKDFWADEKGNIFEPSW